MTQQQRILIVDDEAEFCESISYWLKTKDNQVQASYSAKEALELIKTTPFDIVLIDIYMPDMDGMELLRQIRSFNKTLPIIMVTGYPLEERMDEAVKLGVSGFFPKIESFEQLGSLIKTVLHAHKDLH